MTLCSVLVLAAGCERGFGYQRPPERNIGAIGAPAPSVGSYGLEHGEPTAGSVQDLRGDMAPPTVGTDAIDRPNTPVGVAPRRLTEYGQITDVHTQRVIIATEEGESIELGLRPMTSVTVDGKPSSLRELPRGADVRASFIEQGSQRIAEKLEVRTTPQSEDVELEDPDDVIKE